MGPSTDIKLVRILGSGGFGETSLIELNGQRFVLKRLTKKAEKTYGTDATHEIFIREAELMRLVHDPQIPKLFDSGVDHLGPWTLQSYIPGNTLAEQVQLGNWSESQVEELLRSILPVLNRLHNAGIVHRDIKPENIIFSDIINEFVLVDFGASKLVTETLLKKTGTTIGSAAYCAPEQTIGKATFASDIYSLGVTCLHLLTGMAPFDLVDITTASFAWQDYLSTPVSPELRDILNKMVTRGTKDRYVSASQVLSDLTEAAKLKKIVSLPQETESQIRLYSAILGGSEEELRETAIQKLLVEDSRRQSLTRQRSNPIQNLIFHSSFRYIVYASTVLGGAEILAYIIGSQYPTHSANIDTLVRIYQIPIENILRVGISILILFAILQIRNYSGKKS
jgi:serine/threonine protein kinase